NQRRKLLAAVRGDAGPEFDVYDVSGDCRYPQLLSSVALLASHPVLGHEGSWAPDGLTYYGSDIRYLPAGAVNTGQYYPIDVTDTTKPKVITTWKVPTGGIVHHGLSISDDGNRAYVTAVGNIGAGTAGAFGIPDALDNNGLLIYDVSEIQARRD